MLSDSKEKSFLIDVAKDRTYQNQSEEYNQNFSKWRADEKNPYGYQFTHDTREHSYVDGEGYQLHKADDAEKAALYKCLWLLGISMIIMTCIDLLNNFLLGVLAPNTIGNMTYFSDIYTERNIDLKIAIISGFLTLMRYLIPCIFFKLISKIPKQVAIPQSKFNSKLVGSAVVIMLVIVVLGRIGGFYMSKVLGFFGVDSVYAFVSFGSDSSVRFFNIIYYCLLIPIASEIFYRGFVLQTFRQFGDLFAIILTCLISGFAYYDIPNFGYGILTSVALSLFTIRTGSIATAIIMRVSAHTFNYFLDMLAISDISYGRVIEIAICTLIVGFSIIVYSRLTSNGNWSFNIEPSDTSQIPIGKKMKMVISSNAIAIWIVVAIVMYFINSRVL